MKNTTNNGSFFSRAMRFFFGRRRSAALFNTVNDDFLLVVNATRCTDLQPIINSVKAQTYSHKHFDCRILVNEKQDAVVTPDDNITLFSVSDAFSASEALDRYFKMALPNCRGKYYAAVVVDGSRTLEPEFMNHVNDAVALDRQIVFLDDRIRNLSHWNSKINCMVRMDVLESAGGWPFGWKRNRQLDGILRSLTMGKLHVKACI